MEHRQGNSRGSVPELQAACAVMSGLLLVGLLAYAFASGEWNFAGQMPPEGELATIWQRYDAAPDTVDDAALARR